MESSLDNSDFKFPIDDGRFPDILLQIELIVHSEGSNTIDNENAGVAVVKQLHICSRILAHQSPFFDKLFSNLTGELELRCVTVKIHVIEEAAFMELLKFMYNNTLSVKTKVGLFEVLMVAKKFEVASCMIYCSRLLRNMAMITPDSALHYLKLPSIDAYQPLIDATKKHIVVLYKEISNQWFKEVFMNLPLAGVEAILTNDDLQVQSENILYNFVLKWARKHYINLEERRQVLGARLAPLIRFPYLSYRKLKKVSTCIDFDPDVASKLVLEALLFKDKATTQMPGSSSRRPFMKRAYKYRLVKAINIKFPTQLCVVYMDIKREECTNLFPSGYLYSQIFKLGGHGFYLDARCCMDRENSFHCFGLFLAIQEVEISINCDYVFAARSKPTEEFICMCKNNYTFTGGKSIGYRNVFQIPWTLFMAKDSLYFINGLLHLRVEITIKD